MSFSCIVIIRKITATLPNRNTALYYNTMSSAWTKTMKTMKIFLLALSPVTNQTPFRTPIIKDSCFSYLRPWRSQIKVRGNAARSPQPYTKMVCFLKIEIWTMRGYQCNHNTNFYGSIIADYDRLLEKLTHLCDNKEQNVL